VGPPGYGTDIIPDGPCRPLEPFRPTWFNSHVPVLLNERRGRREELNLPAAPIDRGDLDLRPTRFNGQVSAWFPLKGG